MNFQDKFVYPENLTNCNFSTDRLNSGQFPNDAVQIQSNAQLNLQSEFENYAIGELEILNSLHEESNERAQRSADLMDSYDKRIRDLKQIALDDGISLNPASQQQF